MSEKFRILVPIKFTKNSERALDYALGLTQNMNADIYLFHVLEESTSDFRKLDRLNEEYMERMKQICMAAIERAHKKGIAHTVEDVHRRVAHGKPWVEILRMAGGVSADTIVMGSPSSNNFKKLVKEAPCTVTLVREKDPAFVKA